MPFYQHSLACASRCFTNCSFVDVQECNFVEVLLLISNGSIFHFLKLKTVWKESCKRDKLLVLR